MNLHAIASGAIGVVNPFVPVIIQVSTGYSTNSDRERVPTYADPVTVQGQVQALSAEDLKQLDALNIQGVKQKIYINGRVDGVVRRENKGGDLIAVDGKNYLVTLVLEYWPDWCCFAVTLQDDGDD